MVNSKFVVLLMDKNIMKPIRLPNIKQYNQLWAPRSGNKESLQPQFPVHPLLHIQETLGNQATAHLLQAKFNTEQPEKVIEPVVKTQQNPLQSSKSQPKRKK